MSRSEKRNLPGNENIIIPERLEKGSVIGIAAPSGPAESGKLNSGIEVLKNMGFEVALPDDLFKPQAYLSGSDHHRAEILNNMFLNPEIEAIICARGGYGAMRILPLVDFKAIKENSKMFIGFSDATALLTNIYNKNSQVVFHGPVVTTLSEASDIAIDSLYSMLIHGPDKIEISFEDLDIIHPGQTTAPIIGGNLTTLCHLVGTPFEPSYDDHILFIEDVGEEAYRIDRMLMQLKMAGCFDKLSGLVLGTFEDCGDLGFIYDLVKDIFKEEKFPIMAGLEIGHVNDNLTIPIGLDATLDAYNGILSYLYP